MPSTPRGITYPAGSDRVAVAADLQGMAVTVDAALAEFASVPALADGVDLNDVTASGAVISLGYESHLNVPEADSGVVQTYPLPDGGALQTWQGYNSGSVFARTLSNVGNWSAWRRVSGPALAADGESSATKAVRADDSRLGAAAALPAIYESLATKAEQSEVDLKADASAVPALASDGESSSTKAVRANDARLSDARLPLPAASAGTVDLNTFVTSGSWGQSATSNATPARNYPENSRGILVVNRFTASHALQTYYATYTGRVWVREFYNAVWSPWTQVGPDGSAISKTPTVLGTSDLNSFTSTGLYSQQATSNATGAANYPENSRGILTVWAASASMAVQTYQASYTGRLYQREYYNAVWSPWTQVGGDPTVPSRVSSLEASRTATASDVAGLQSARTSQGNRITALEAAGGLTNPVTGATVNGSGLLQFTLANGTTTPGLNLPASLPTDQADYVQQLRRRSPLTRLELKKTSSLGAVEVSAYSPAGIHTTYEIRGASDGPSSDDFRTVLRVWTGDTTGSTRNKSFLIAPASVREFAIQVIPTGSGLPYEFMPDHGPATAFAVEAPRMFSGGVPVDVAAMSTNQVVQLDGRFELVQHVMGRHPSAPATDLIEFWTVTSIGADGVLSVDGRMRAASAVTIGAAYGAMAPVSDAFTSLVTSLNNAYPHDAGMNGTSTFLPAESDVATSYIFVSSADHDQAVAVRYNNPASTLRRGQPNKYPEATMTRLEHRTDGMQKLYHRLWANDLPLAAGYEHRWSVDMLHLRAPGVYDQVVR